MTRVLSAGELVADRFEVRAELERAAALRAYRVFDREVEVEVVLWQMRDELYPDPGKRRAFVGAVDALRGLRHPNLRRMFGAGDAGGVLFATAQLETDDGMLPRPGDGRRLTDDELLHYATSVSSALDVAHAAGLVHGRLTPGDIVHVAGLIKVGCIGIYGDIDATAARGLWMADERFIAPEVLSGERATPAADVYSLAALIGELATGTTHDEVTATVGALGRSNPQLAEALRVSLSMSPDRRPQNAGELFDQVAAALGIEPTAYDSKRAIAPAPGRPDSEVEDDDAVPTGQLPALAPPTLPEAEPIGPELADADAVSTRQMRKISPAAVRAGKPSGKRGGADFGDAADLETMTEGPWVAATGAPPPPAYPPPAGQADPAPPDPGDNMRTIPEGAPVTPPAGTPSVPQPVKKVRSKPIMVSHKARLEGSSPKKPPVKRVPVADRPDLKPVVRAISEVRKQPAQVPLGNYAPPRTRAAGARSRRWLIAAAIGGLLIVAGGAAAIYLLTRGGAAPTAADAAPPPPLATGPTPVVTVQPDAAPATPCPPAMVEVTRPASADDPELHYCIDRFEAPGEGRMPTAGLSFAQAEAACSKRKVRLCTGDEWEYACRGERGASWPYGSAYRGGVCNVRGGSSEIAVAGSFRGCESAVGAFDMSGNVGEWVQGQVVRGGSAADRSRGRCSRVVRRVGTDAAAFADVGYRCCADPRSSRE